MVEPKVLMPAISAISPTASLIDKLQWRYAAKKMDASQPVPAEKVERIVEAIRLTATSSGLQPYEIIVVTNPELRQKMREIGYNQSPITEGSHVLVFAAWDNYTAERINRMFGWENYRKVLLNAYPVRDAQLNFEHAARQAYIGLGTALIAAAEEGVDSTPMEGFDAAAMDALLGLPERGLRSVVILPLGYRDVANDWLVNLKKVRRTRENFVTEIA